MLQKVGFCSAGLITLTVMCGVGWGQEPAAERIIPLEEIVVTATRELPSLYHSPASVSVITADLIDARNVYTVGQMVNTAPNMRLEGTTKGAFKCPCIRGFGASNNIVLLDGIPMNTGFANWGNITSLPANDIRRIEIVRGSNSIVYGPNALGGVINIISRKGEGRLSPKGLIRWGSNNFQKYLASLGGGRERVDCLFTLSRDRSDGYLPNTDYEALNFSTNLGYRVGRTNLRFNGGYIDAEAGVPIDPKAPQRIEPWRGWRGSLALQSRLSPRWHLSANSYVNREKYTIRVYTDTTFAAVKKELPNRGVTYGGEVVNNFALAPNHLLTSGLQVKSDDVDFAYVGGQRQARIYSGFLQHISTYREKVTLNLGLRADGHSSAGSTVNYNLGLVLRPRRLTKLRLSYGTASRFPAIRELYMVAPAPGRGDIDLKTEESITFEAGLELLVAPLTEAKLTYFRTEAENLIERDLAQKPWVFANISSALMEGVELELSREALGRWGYFLNFSSLKAKNTQTDETLNFRPRYQASGGLRYRTGGWDFNLTERYVGRQQYTQLDARQTLDGYLVTEVKFNYTLGSYGQLSMAVDTLFDKGYDLEGHQQARPTTPGPSRNYTVGYSVGF
ncbi:MAG: TonB-dependent receptor plug domain-containing protein [bacterium]